MNPAHGGDDGMPYAIIVFISVVRLLAYVFVLVALLQKDKQHNKNGKSDFVIYRVGVLRAPLHRHRCVNNAM